MFRCGAVIAYGTGGRLIHRDWWSQPAQRCRPGQSSLSCSGWSREVFLLKLAVVSVNAAASHHRCCCGHHGCNAERFSPSFVQARKVSMDDDAEDGAFNPGEVKAIVMKVRGAQLASARAAAASAASSRASAPQPPRISHPSSADIIPRSSPWLHFRLGRSVITLCSTKRLCMARSRPGPQRSSRMCSRSSLWRTPRQRRRRRKSSNTLVRAAASARARAPHHAVVQRPAAATAIPAPRHRRQHLTHHPTLTPSPRARSSIAVTCQMQQKTGSAMITACAQYWDKATDGYASTKWESEAVQVLVTVYGIAI